MDFALFSPAHLSILIAVASIAAVLSWVARSRLVRARTIRFSLATLLAGNELVWYAYRLRFEGFRFPEALPLQLCDLSLWLTVLAALTLRPRVFELAYFGGLGGSGMALLTPDLWAPLVSYPTVYFFLSHGFVVVTLWVLTWGHIARPRPGSLWRAVAGLNVYVAAVAGFNAVFETNYMFLCRKPESASLLDYFGPWPAYIVVAELFAVAVFWLLWLPVRQSNGAAVAGNSATYRHV